jgi:hypothetical protein
LPGSILEAKPLHQGQKTRILGRGSQSCSHLYSKGWDDGDTVREDKMCLFMNSEVTGRESWPLARRKWKLDEYRARLDGCPPVPASDSTSAVTVAAPRTTGLQRFQTYQGRHVERQGPRTPAAASSPRAARRDHLLSRLRNHLLFIMSDTSSTIESDYD